MVKVSPTIISQNEKYQGNMTGLLFMRGDQKTVLSSLMAVML